jgi:hypothetical protein
VDSDVGKVSPAVLAKPKPSTHLDLAATAAHSSERESVHSCHVVQHSHRCSPAPLCAALAAPADSSSPLNLPPSSSLRLIPLLLLQRRTICEFVLDARTYFLRKKRQKTKSEENYVFFFGFFAVGRVRR